jgi:hypothetical protein
MQMPNYFFLTGVDFFYGHRDRTETDHPTIGPAPGSRAGMAAQAGERAGQARETGFSLYVGQESRKAGLPNAGD